MKKRRTRVRNPKSAARSSGGESSLPPRSKSFQELKGRYTSENVKQTSTRKSSRTQEHEVLKKDTFDSLESFFDVKRPLHLPDVESYIHSYDDQGETSSELLSDKSLENFDANFSQYSANQLELEPNILLQDYESTECNFNRGLNRLEELSFDLQQQETYYSKMASRNNILEEGETNRGIQESTVQEDDKSSAPTAAEYGDQGSAKAHFNDREHDNEGEVDGKEDDEHKEDDDGITEDENYEESTEGEEGSDSLPAYLEQIPEEEIMKIESKSTVHFNTSADEEASSLKLDSHDKFFLSVSSLTDSALLQEMAIASDRCVEIKKKIELLQEELLEMQQKEDLSEGDHEALEKKRQDLMDKMSELEIMTRRIQQLLGLADPSSEIYDKVFKMLPSQLSFKPILAEMEDDELSIPDQSEMSSDKGDEEQEEEGTEKIDQWKAWEEFPEEDRLHFPQQEYPEDRLPRVIVCGYTEDKIPKIVVADSEQRSRAKQIQHLETMTGKLTAALNMQERLARENAQLEGGKYKLEEALLEKDDTVDNLQQKVCGLQKELRLVVKENAELSRKLASLDERITKQVCVACQGEYSHYSPVNTSRRSDKSSRCRCSSQEHPDFLQSNTVCESPRDCPTSRYSPRLSGGGSRTFQSSPDQSQIMSYRSPAMVLTSVRDSSPGRGTCPAEIKDKLNSYEANTKQLEQQLGSMESEVQNMKMELANVQRERQQLDQQRKLLKCTGPCAPCPCTPPAPVQGSPSGPQPILTPATAPQDPQTLLKQSQAIAGSIPSCTGVCTNVPMGASSCPLQQLRDLREQYARLQEDYRNKLTEVSCLRADAEKMKQDTRDCKDAKERAENRLIDLEERLKIFENERNRFSGSKEQMMEQEQTLIVAKQRYREAQEELEELRTLIQDQANQLEDYRNKYLQAQEHVEEQRRQLDLMEMDNARMNENVTLEIGRVKNQFQEKLAELAPLPDILKQTQIKLQEAQQLRLLAERNCEELSRELLNCKDKIGAMTSQSEILRSENAVLKGGKGTDSGHLDDLEDKNRELRNENERMKNALARMEEREAEYQKRIDEKMHEIAQLTSMLEQVREDSARQVARTKERCETVRRSLQGQISEMEKELAQCRAIAKAAQKDRDEIRQKMQSQINHLSEAFEHAQGRVRTLQGHVNYLKTSYSNIFSIEGQGDRAHMTSLSPEASPNPYDGCDCNY